MTRKGPAEVVLVTAMSEVLTPPPPARLSRTVQRKVMVRLVAGSRSPKTKVLLRRLTRRGMVRLGLVVGVQERMKGLWPLSRMAPETEF